MARIRSVKPAFYTDEELNDLPLEAHFLFGALWTLADREGRLEDKPRTIKLAVFPFRDVDVDPLLSLLAKKAGSSGKTFITRYEVGGIKCIQINNFLRHQIPTRDEPQSELPSPDGQVERYEKPPNETVRARIYQRDRFLCAYCGLDMRDKGRARCLDHVIPYSRGGSNDEGNLVTSCKRCNATKSDKTPSEVGFDWPAGFGRTREKMLFDDRAFSPPQPPVNPPLTGSDKEGEGEGERERKGKGNRTVAPSGLPDGVLVPDDLKPWEKDILNWIAYKRDRGQRYKGEKGLNALWSVLRKIEPELRSHSIEFAIASNWAGIYEKRPNDKDSRPAGSVADKDKYAHVSRSR